MLKLLKTWSILLVLIAMDEISLFSLNYPSISQWIWRFSVVRNKCSLDSLYLRFFRASTSVRSAMCRCFQIVKFIYVLALDAITVTARNVWEGNSSVFWRWGFESLQSMLDSVRFGRTSAETSQMPITSAGYHLPQVSSRKFILFTKSSSPK